MLPKEELVLQLGQSLNFMEQDIISPVFIHCFNHFRFSLLLPLQTLPGLPCPSHGSPSPRYLLISPFDTNFSFYWTHRPFTFWSKTFCSFYAIVHFMIFCLFIESSNYFMYKSYLPRKTGSLKEKAMSHVCTIVLCST